MKAIKLSRRLFKKRMKTATDEEKVILDLIERAHSRYEERLRDIKIMSLRQEKNAWKQLKKETDEICYCRT